MTRRQRHAADRATQNEPAQLILRDERGVVHYGWRITHVTSGNAMRMGCSYYAMLWSPARHPVTCVWCIVGRHPYLCWGPGARENI